MQLETMSNFLRDQSENYIQYIHQKLKEHDWHAVSDACNDLREIEAKIDLLTSMIKNETSNI